MDVRLKKKWVVLRYPNNSLAQAFGSSLDAFEDFYFKVCNLDYSKMSKAMDNLVELMNKTDKVRLVAKDTDISFSIKDIPAIKCAGEMNIPDGEFILHLLEILLMVKLLTTHLQSMTVLLLNMLVLNLKTARL